ncbi:MAG: sodium:proton antiporter [Defluviitaleaceae bacterium]|nr:sodium:proton antiporter [Defluviitaleaceae bacterium]
MGGVAFHFPLFIIFLPMLASIVMPLLRSSNIARNITLAVQVVMIGLSLGLTVSLWVSPAPYFTYLMGYFPAPFGNEIRAGMLEALLACAFSTVLLFSILGTAQDTDKDISESKRPLFYCMINLLNTSLMALVFTNDIFTAYVFIEVNTLAACAIVAAKENRDTLKATIKYLLLSVMGSGMFLLSTAFLYSITGHLLMEPAREVITALVADGQYQFPLTMTILLFIVSMAVKSALFPFHTWLPDAHGSATTASSAILSGLVIKGYIVMLLKLLYRVYGIETVAELGVFHVLFLLGITGMIAGSVMACFQTKLKRLIAYSSVAQIGYIFVGMGLDTQGGFTAASYHIIAHAFTKSMLFIAAGALISAAGSYTISDMTGTARKNKMAGIAFTVGALSMVGIPLFAGFVSKFYLAGAAVQGHISIWITMPVLAISTFINGLYYFPVLVRIYSKPEYEGDAVPALPVGKLKPSFAANFTLVCLIAANVALGIFFAPLLGALESGFLWLG